jgi:hypothetical protein
MLQEAAALQWFSQFARLMIGVMSKSSRVIETARNGVARTLSRDFWQ